MKNDEQNKSVDLPKVSHLGLVLFQFFVSLLPGGATIPVRPDARLVEHVPAEADEDSTGDEEPLVAEI